MCPRPRSRLGDRSRKEPHGQFGTHLSRGAIYYIAYRWNGREYRESTRSTERRVADRLLASRVADGRGRGHHGPLTFDHLAAWYLDDYLVRRPPHRGHGARARGESTGDVWETAGDGHHDGGDSVLSADAPGGRGRGGDGESRDLGTQPDAAASDSGWRARPPVGLSGAIGGTRAAPRVFRTCGLRSGPPGRCCMVRPGKAGQRGVTMR